jgi:hypothetical protein
MQSRKGVTHELPAFLNPFFRQLSTFIFFGLVFLEFVFHVEQAAAELPQNILREESAEIVMQARSRAREEASISADAEAGQKTHFFMLFENARRLRLAVRYLLLDLLVHLLHVVHPEILACATEHSFFQQLQRQNKHQANE